MFFREAGAWRLTCDSMFAPSSHTNLIFFCKPQIIKSTGAHRWCQIACVKCVLSFFPRFLSWQPLQPLDPYVSVTGSLMASVYLKHKGPGKSPCPGPQQPRPVEALRMDFVWPALLCSEWKKASHLAKISSVVTIVLKEAELNSGA